MIYRNVYTSWKALSIFNTLYDSNQWQWVEHLSVLHGGSLEFFLQTKSIQGFLDYFDVYDLVLLEILEFPENLQGPNEPGLYEQGLNE